MKRRRIIFFCALVLMAAGGVALWPRGPKEPVYQGKPLSHWLEQLGTYYVITNGETGIKAMGREILPFLKPMLTERDSRLKERLVRWLRTQFKIKARYTPASVWRYRAERACQLLGPLAVDLLPELQANMNDPDQMVATYALGAIMRVKGKPQALPEILVAMTNSHSNVRLFSVQTFFEFSGEAGVSFPRFLELMQFDTGTASHISNAIYEFYPAYHPEK